MSEKNRTQLWDTIQQQSNESIELAKSKQWHALPALLKNRQGLLDEYFNHDIPENEKPTLITQVQEIIEKNKELEKMTMVNHKSISIDIKKILYNKKSMNAYKNIVDNNT